MKLTAFTCLAFLVNRTMHKAPVAALSYKEVFDATDEGRLVDLLVERYGAITDFTWVTQAHAASIEQMEAAFHDVAAAFEGRIGKPTGPLSGLWLVMDIILEAIQRYFYVSPAPPIRPKHNPGQALLPPSQP